MSVQQSPSEGGVSSEAQVVEFRLGEDVCAIDIDQVDSIVEVKKVIRIPRTPDSIEGVMDLRGETTAIIDPKEFLSVSVDDSGDSVLVLDRPDDKQRIGIRVDVVSYAPDQVDDGDDLENLDTRGIREKVARGIIRKPNGDGLDLVVWIDVDRMIDRLK
ncbi:chemotaxis protein CheW [Halomicrococcus sp. NG-SE-24]|uniref:chemotaxis protein CheW n=1 Tax=Halomicrococcus sp. NG-SE-24 TaxID=3436928 RepID=UPI003D984410